MISQICTNCKKERLIPNTQKNVKFCSKSCASTFTLRERRDFITKICPNCDKEFELLVGYRNRNRKFCSHLCGAQGRLKLTVIVKLICPVCKKEFETSKVYADQGRKYCSQSCGNIGTKASERFKAGVNFIEDLGHVTHSSLETFFCRFLVGSGIEYEYEPKTFGLVRNDKLVNFTPDLWIPEFNQFWEIKAVTDRYGPNYMTKARLFKEQYPKDRLIIVTMSKTYDIEYLL